MRAIKLILEPIARSASPNRSHGQRVYHHNCSSVNLTFDDDDGDEDVQAEGLVAMAAEKIRVGVAADSGATDNVIGFDGLPAGVIPEGPPGPPFSNASGGDIKKYGKVVTMM